MNELRKRLNHLAILDDVENGGPYKGYAARECMRAIKDSEKALGLYDELTIDLAASLAAAISLLEASGKAAKKAAPSDKMFDIMLTDYKKSLERARNFWKEQETQRN